VNIQLGRTKIVRRAYGIDEIALVPGRRTVDPGITKTNWEIGGIERDIPIIASAMDGVVDVNMAVALSKLGALGVLNLEGVQTRYEDPKEVLTKIQSIGKEEFVPLMQEIYNKPIKEKLILKRIQEIKDSGGIAAVSGTPLAAIKYRTPVFLLTDGYLANGSEPWSIPDFDDLPNIDPNFAVQNDDLPFMPYARDE